jgi:2'-5' RNA ligase
MRLFVAVDLSDEVRASISALSRRLAERAGHSRGLRFVRPEQLHLTLVFIGDVEAARGTAIARSLEPPFECSPFDLQFEGLGTFPPSGAPRVLWLGVTGGAEQAVALQNLVAARLERVGVPRERRPFSPHLTLARWRQSRPSDRQAMVSDLATGRFRMAVSGITLYESCLSSAGSTYTAVVRPTLASPDAR